MISGNHRGTETASVPPGRSTRTSSSMAWMSAGMCSSTSAATTRSNSPSAKGSESASPSLTSASAPSGTSPASFIAAKSSRTPESSSASWSKAITSPPRRYISKAWRPAPQPMSRTRSPGRSPRRSKSTVSTGAPHLVLLAPVVGDHVLVRRRDGRRDRPPAEHLLHPLPAGPAHPLPALGVVEQRGDRRLQLEDVAGRDQVGAQAVGAHDLGDRSGPRDDQGGGAGHQLGGG